MKIIYLLSVLALTLTFGCSSKETKVVEKTTETVKVTEEPAKEEGTEIKIGPDGGSVKTKDVKIEINE